MSILSDLQKTLGKLSVPMETGVFQGPTPDEYLVIVPLDDTFDVHADNSPGIDVQEARFSIYSKDSYIKLKNAVVKKLLAADFTITGRSYIGFETDTGYHHYNVDAAKYYEM